jgi:SAM-dependent methyltransferase
MPQLACVEARPSAGGPDDDRPAVGLEMRLVVTTIDGDVLARQLNPGLTHLRDARRGAGLARAAYDRKVRLHRPGIRTRLRVAARRLKETPHWLVLRRLGKRRSPEYRDYLATQLRRTLSKRETDPGSGAETLINRVAQQQPSRGAVLCIGCRNGLELDRFRARGFDEVVGIDIFSQRPDILTMDMHEMSFADDSFDIVYASHSLEHSYDVDRVAGEIGRVARDGAVIGVEVPVRAQASDADRIVFSGLDELRGVFRLKIGEELLAEEQLPHTPTNEQGTEIARLVFRLKKES